RRFRRSEVSELQRFTIEWRERSAEHVAVEDDHRPLHLVAVSIVMTKAFTAKHGRDARGSHGEAGLLVHLARDRFGGSLAGIDCSGGERPLAIVGSTQEEDASVIIAHDGG